MALPTVKVVRKGRLRAAMIPWSTARSSSVVCSGRVGSLYNEVVDAETYASWGVDYVKYDNCGEYGLGNARFVAFADAANATGRSMFISTEPFLLVPNPSHATFSNSWRTTNDINP
jgi:alpha-galactosidase